MPAVMNTMSASATASLIAASSSSADRRPVCGSPPEPRPRVVLTPIWMRIGASDCDSACMSVFATMNSTPRNPAPIMRFTALPPAPPQPITFSLAELLRSISSSNVDMGTLPGSGSRASCPFAPGVMDSEQIGEPVAEVEARPGLGPVVDLDEIHPTLLGLGRVQHQAHACGVARIAHVRGQSPEAARKPQSDRHLEHLLGELRRPRQQRRPTREHYPATDQGCEVILADLLVGERENL